MEERNEGMNKEAVRGAVEFEMMDLRRNEGEKGVTEDCLSNQCEGNGSYPLCAS